MAMFNILGWKLYIFMFFSYFLKLPDDDDEVPDGHGVSVVSERRESGLDLNQLLSSCPNLSVKDMADKNSELGSVLFRKRILYSSIIPPQKNVRHLL